MGSQLDFLRASVIVEDENVDFESKGENIEGRTLDRRNIRGERRSFWKNDSGYY
jgi:hypothetical protein